MYNYVSISLQDETLNLYWIPLYIYKESNKSFESVYE